MRRKQIEERKLHFFFFVWDRKYKMIQGREKERVDYLLTSTIRELENFKSLTSVLLSLTSTSDGICHYIKRKGKIWAVSKVLSSSKLEIKKHVRIDKEEKELTNGEHYFLFSVTYAYVFYNRDINSQM
jgi:hypothetical protein